MFEEITKQNKVDVARWRADPEIGGRRKMLELQLREQAEKRGRKFVYAKMMDYLIDLGMDAHDAKEKPVQSNLPAEKPKPKAKPEKWNKKRFADELIKLGADESHVNDWMTSRKTFTETSFKSTIKHINNTNQTVAQIVELCAEKGWQGFDAKYLDGINRTATTRGRKQVDQSGFGDEPSYIDGEVISNQQGFLNNE